VFKEPKEPKALKVLQELDLKALRVLQELEPKALKVSLDLKALKELKVFRVW
jgi:hypothetical protein